MKHIFILLLFSLSCGITKGQTTVGIDLKQWKGKNEHIPFSISSIDDQREDPEYIGTITVNRGKAKKIIFESNSSEMIQQFVDKNFEQGEEMNVRLEIDLLKVEENNTKKKKKVTAFLFACKFYNATNNDSKALYSFNARNSIPKKNALKLSMTNYIGRALTSAILNFRKSYKKHPAWKKPNKKRPTVKVKKEILFNQFIGGDTVALNMNYKLKPTDFAGIVGEDVEEDAYSYFLMTYTLRETDSENEVNLKIIPKTFFLRSKSWAKKTDNNKWLAHQQLLFDLASYHAYLFKKQLEEKIFSPGFYKAEINKIYNKVSATYFDEMDDLQAQTQFGENSEKEAEWRRKIDQYLIKK